MYFPPEQHRPYSSIAAGSLSGLFPAFLAYAFGVPVPFLVPVFLLFGIAGMLMGAWAAWRSVFGTFHAWAATLWMILVFFLPASLIFPVAALRDQGLEAQLWISAALVLAQLLLLGGAALFHYRRCPVTDGEVLDWPGTRVDLRKRVLRKRVARQDSREGRAFSPWALGAASVAFFGILKPFFLSTTGILVIAIGANLLWAGFSAGPMGRALGQAIRLRAIERQGGRRFVTASLSKVQGPAL